MYQIGDNKVEYDAECLEDIKAVGLVTVLCNLMSRNKSYKTRKEQQKNKKGSTSLSKTTIKPNSDIVK